MEIDKVPFTRSKMDNILASLACSDVTGDEYYMLSDLVVQLFWSRLSLLFKLYNYVVHDVVYKLETISEMWHIFYFNGQ